MMTERTPLLSQLAGAAEPERDASPLALARLGAAYSALSHGKLPSSLQIATAVLALEQSSVLSIDTHPSGGHIAGEGRFSNQGRQAVDDLKRILRAVRALALAKNGNNALQELVYHSKHADVDIKAGLVGTQDSQLPNVQLEEAQRDLSLLLLALRTVARLVLANILSSSQSMLDDTFFLFRSVLADAAGELAQRAGKAADVLRPNEAPVDSQEPTTAAEVENEGLRLKATLAEAGSAAFDATSQTQGLQSSIMTLADQDFRDVTLSRLNTLIVRIRRDTDATMAFEVILNLAQKYLNKVEEASQAAQKAVDDTHIDVQLPDEQQHAQNATSAFRNFVESISGRSLDNILSLFSKTANDVKSNTDLTNFFRDVDLYLRKLLKEPQWAAGQQARRQGEELWERGRTISLANPVWKFDLNSISGELHLLYEGFKNDEAVCELGAAIAAFTGDVETLMARGLWTAFGDTRGIAADVINIIVPRIFKLLKQFPIPRTEFVSPVVDAVLDDFCLSSLSFLPTFLKIDQHSEFVLQREVDVEAQRTVTTADGSGRLYIRGLHISAHDISYWFRRKVWRWLPGFRQDSGLVEFSLEKKGLEADISYKLNESVAFERETQSLEQLRQKQEDDTRESFFTISNVDVRLSSLDLKIRRSQHPIFFWLMRPFARFTLKTALRYTLSSQLKSGLEYVDQVIFKLHQQVQRLQLRGFGPIEAWITAFAQPAPDVLQTGFAQVQKAAQDTQTLFKATTFTNKGIITTDEHGTKLAIGAGAQILPAEAGGPQHHGPSGNHGSGSTGRIGAEVDESLTAAKQTAQHEAQVAGQGLLKARKKLGILQGEVDQFAEGTELEQELETESGWRTAIFDLL